MKKIKKRIYRSHAKTYYLDDDNCLYKKQKKNPRLTYNNNFKEIEEEKEIFVLLKIPQTFRRFT